jgi:PAS domain S-box-containing protein
MRRFFSRLQVRLLFLVLLALVPALGITLYSAAQQGRLETERAQREALQMVHLVTNDQARLMEGADQLLRALAQVPQVRAGDAQACNQFMTGVLQQYRVYTNLGVSRPDGTVWCSAVALAGPTNFGDRDWFRQILQSREFTASDYLIGRITGRSIITSGYPILDKNGEIQGIVWSPLDLAWLNQRLADTALPPGASLLVVDRNGTILARYPDQEHWVGQTLTSAPLIAAMLAQHEGQSVLTGLDGLERLYVYAPLPGRSNLAGSIASQTNSQPSIGYVSVGIPTALAYAAVNRALASSLALLTLLGVITGAGLWFFTRNWLLAPVQTLGTTAERLANGDLQARAGLLHGPAELGQLARTFDEMAVALEERQALLVAAEARYRTLVEQIPAVTYAAPSFQRGAPLYMSPQIEQLLGFPVAAWTTDPTIWERQVHPEDRLRVQAELATSQNDQKPFRCEYRMLAQDGHVVWVRDEAVLIYDARDRAPYSQGVLVNITERKQDEAQRAVILETLACRARELAALYETSLEINLQPDLPALLQEIVARAASLLGATTGGLYLLRPDDETLELVVAHKLPDDCTGTRLHIGEGLSGRVAQTGQPMMLTDHKEWPGRATVYATAPFHRVLAIPLKVRGRVIGVINITDAEQSGPFTEEEVRLASLFADQAAIAVENARLYTSLETANRELQAALQTKDEILQNVSHELRTPLTHIRGYGEVLRDGMLGPLVPAQREALDVVVEKTDRLARLVSALLTLQTFGTKDLVRQRLDVNNFLYDLAGQWGSMISKGLNLSIIESEPPLAIDADPERLRQVFDQLLDNALKYGTESGQLALAACAHEHTVWLGMSDSGIGIPSDKIEKIFDRFYQVDGSMTRRQGGAGIGLALVRKIVEAHGGRVWAESPGWLGYGTTFVIELPQAG